jgi:hypothetical protein
MYGSSVYLIGELKLWLIYLNILGVKHCHGMYEHWSEFLRACGT